ncbi:MAG: hypothetical protein ABR527_07790 [Gemmatimonadota bacterium]
MRARAGRSGLVLGRGSPGSGRRRRDGEPADAGPGHRPRLVRPTRRRRGAHLRARNDGQAWCWGSDEFGELGDGATGLRRIPVQVMEP